MIHGEKAMKIKRGYRMRGFLKNACISPEDHHVLHHLLAQVVIDSVDLSLTEVLCKVLKDMV
jgi:hypothetical protein